MPRATPAETPVPFSSIVPRPIMQAMFRARAVDVNPNTAAMLARFLFLLLLSVGPARAATRAFAIDPRASSVRVHVGKTGIASFAGHEHDVVARSLRGEVSVDFDDLSRASVEVTIDARSLTVVPEGEPE